MTDPPGDGVALTVPCGAGVATSVPCGAEAACADPPGAGETDNVPLRWLVTPDRETLRSVYVAVLTLRSLVAVSCASADDDRRTSVESAHNAVVVEAPSAAIVTSVASAQAAVTMPAAVD